MWLGHIRDSTKNQLKYLQMSLLTVVMSPSEHEAPFTLHRCHTKTVQKCSVWPTVYTVPFSYPASNEDCCITKY